MLGELPMLSDRIKEFVRNNPLDDMARGTSDNLKATQAYTGKMLVDAAKASRFVCVEEIANDTLTLAQVKAYENTINRTPIGRFPNIGGGLLRITEFSIKTPFSLRCDARPTMHAHVEYSPLGWPELPDMVTTEFNTLFRKPEPSTEAATPPTSGRREFL